MNVKKLRAAKFALPVLLLIVMFLQVVLSIRQQSQTIDEGVHLVAGYRYWQCHDYGINSEHPPLVKFVAAAPLWFGHIPAPSGPCGKEPTTKGYVYGLGFNYLYSQDLDADSLLFHARLAAAFFLLVLAISCYLCARSFFGQAAGLIALLLLVFEPTVLAHGALITTDTAVSAFLLAAVFSFYRYWQRPAARWLIVAGILTGLTLASKHSGVLVIPILVILALFEFMRVQRSGQPETRQSLRQSGVPKRAARLGWWDILRHTGGLAVIFLVALTVLWSTYGLRFGARPANQPMSMNLNQFIAESQEQGAHGSFLTVIVPSLARVHLLPEAYLYGLVDVLSVSYPGQPPYLLGKLYPHGKWFYFPVTFLIKSTLGFLVLFLISIMVVPWRNANLSREVFYLVVPPVIILGFAMYSGLNIGYRHVLPIVGFLCVLIAGGVVSLFRRNRFWRYVTVTLLTLHLASSLYAFPNYLPYSNEAWGGSSQTYRYLTDSNVDWGQGLYQTKDYLARHHIEDCWIGYDGTANISYYQIPCRKLSANAGSVEQDPPASADGIFILSALTVSGIEWEPGDLNPYRVFQTTRPISNIGGAMLVYQGNFDLTGLAATTHVSRADSHLDAGKPGEALLEAQSAVTLTPLSIRAHLSLGRAFAALGRRDDARQELQTMITLAEKMGSEWYPSQIASARRELRKVDPDDLPGKIRNFRLTIDPPHMSQTARNDSLIRKQR